MPLASVTWAEGLRHFQTLLFGQYCSQHWAPCSEMERGNCAGSQGSAKVGGGACGQPSWGRTSCSFSGLLLAILSCVSPGASRGLTRVWRPRNFTFRKMLPKKTPGPFLLLSLEHSVQLYLFFLSFSYRGLGKVILYLGLALETPTLGFPFRFHPSYMAPPT